MVQFCLDVKQLSKPTKAVINDINEDLINTYKTIASRPRAYLILEILQTNFTVLKDMTNKKEYYYSKRSLQQRTEEQSVPLFIFLTELALDFTG